MSATAQKTQADLEKETERQRTLKELEVYLKCTTDMITTTLTDEVMINFRSKLLKIPKQVIDAHILTLPNPIEKQERYQLIQQRFDQLDNLEKTKAATAAPTTPPPASNGGLFAAAYNAGANALGYLKGASSSPQQTGAQISGGVVQPSAPPLAAIDQETPGKPSDVPSEKPKMDLRSATTTLTDEQQDKKGKEKAKAKTESDSDSEDPTTTEPNPNWLTEDMDDVKKRNAKTETADKENKRIEEARLAAERQKADEQAMQVITGKLGAHNMHAYHRLTLVQQQEILAAYRNGGDIHAVSVDTRRTLFANTES